MMVLKRRFANHHVVLLLLLFLSLLLKVHLLKTLLRHLLAPIHVVGHLLITEIRRRMGCGDDMIRNLLRALVQIHPRLVPFCVLSEVVLAGIFELRVALEEARV